MNIRTKLILMMAIPIAALVLIAGVGFSSQSGAAEKNEDAAAVASSVSNLEELALDISDERLTSARLVLANVDEATASQAPALAVELEEAVAATDATILRIEESGDSVAAPTATSVSVLLGLARDLDATTDATGTYNSALVEIDNTIDPLVLSGFSADAVIAVQSVQDAREVINTQESIWIRFLLTSAEGTVEDGTVEDSAVEARPTESLITPLVISDITNGFGHADFIAGQAASRTLSTGDRPMVSPTTTNTYRELSAFQALAKEDLLQGTIDDIDPAEVLPVLLESRVEWNAAIANALNFLDQDIKADATNIDSSRSLFTLFAVLGSLLLFTLIFVIGRSILGPLGRLLDHADITTNERLPFAVAKLRTLGSSDEAPELRSIPRETDDEIGLLVDAFNGIQDTAIKVATDQARSRRNVAEMFVSLGRRNQQLNHRMLNLITDLERDEQDAETLAGLYQLDHLATRMRRNAESLLVLAGNRSPRQWSRPVPIENVVRSSLSEVELYERVVLGDLPQVAMQGNVVADVTHLLAELLDNATQFSEPSTSVNVSAQETIEGVEIEVFDEGFGIGEKDLIELNERITNPPALDEAPSRLLGLFVVGRLSEQHGIYVELQSQPGVGTVATISIPNSLFAEEVEDTNAIQPPSALAGAAAPAIPAVLPARRDLSAIEEIDIDEAVEAGDMPIVPAEEAGDMPIEVDASAPAAPAEIPSWDPAAVHEEQLADAAMPTMDEVNDAMPSFPGVTIDEPVSHAPAGAAPSNDAWPLTKLDEASTRDEEPAPAPTVAEVPAPVVEVEAPIAEVPAPVVQAEAPIAEAPIHAGVEPVQPAIDDLPPIEPFSIAPPLPEVVDTPAPNFDPAPDYNAAFDAAPVAEAPAPVVNAASSLPAPPVLDAAPELPVAAQPASQPAPQPVSELPAAAVPMQEPVVESGSFGGLPTRSPQATLSDVEQAPAVMPLGDAMPAASEAAPANPSAFAAFATGVNRGLDEVRDGEFSNEGEEA